METSAGLVRSNMRSNYFVLWENRGVQWQVTNPRQPMSRQARTSKAVHIILSLRVPQRPPALRLLRPAKPGVIQPPQAGSQY